MMSCCLERKNMAPSKQLNAIKAGARSENLNRDSRSVRTLVGSCNGSRQQQLRLELPLLATAGPRTEQRGAKINNCVSN